MTSLATAPDVAGSSSAPNNKIQVIVVDDSAVVRGLVSRWVDEDPYLETVGRFANGKLAVEAIADCKPDVVILDIEMPVMDGMTALPLLLRNHPGVKILMSSTLTRRNAEISMNALSLGATDYIPKPESNRGVTTSREFRTDLLRKIKAIVPRKGRGHLHLHLPRGRNRVLRRINTPYRPRPHLQHQHMDRALPSCPCGALHRLSPKYWP
jgi:chemotaxis response regulator CheB